jgi:hypothetical protein
VRADAEKSTIYFMTTLVPFLVLWNSILPSVTLAVVSGLLERLIQLEVAYLPDD